MCNFDAELTKCQQIQSRDQNADQKREKSISAIGNYTPECAVMVLMCIYNNNHHHFNTHMEEMKMLATVPSSFSE